MEANEKQPRVRAFSLAWPPRCGALQGTWPMGYKTSQWAVAPFLVDQGVLPFRLSFSDLIHFHSVWNETYSHLTHPIANQILPLAAQKAFPHIQLLLSVPTTESSHWQTQHYSHLGLLWPRYSTPWMPGTMLLKKT